MRSVASGLSANPSSQAPQWQPSDYQTLLNNGHFEKLRDHFQFRDGGGRKLDLTHDTPLEQGLTSLGLQTLVKLLNDDSVCLEELLLGDVPRLDRILNALPPKCFLKSLDLSKVAVVKPGPGGSEDRCPLPACNTDRFPGLVDSLASLPYFREIRINVSPLDAATRQKLQERKEACEGKIQVDLVDQAVAGQVRMLNRSNCLAQLNARQWESVKSSLEMAEVDELNLAAPNDPDGKLPSLHRDGAKALAMLLGQKAAARPTRLALGDVATLQTVLDALPECPLRTLDLSHMRIIARNEAGELRPYAIQEKHLAWLAKSIRSGHVKLDRICVNVFALEEKKERDALHNLCAAAAEKHIKVDMVDFPWNATPAQRLDSAHVSQKPYATVAQQAACERLLGLLNENQIAGFKTALRYPFNQVDHLNLTYPGQLLYEDGAQSLAKMLCEGVVRHVSIGRVATLDPLLAALPQMPQINLDLTHAALPGDYEWPTLSGAHVDLLHEAFDPNRPWMPFVKVDSRFLDRRQRLKLQALQSAGANLIDVFQPEPDARLENWERLNLGFVLDPASGIDLSSMQTQDGPRVLTRAGMEALVRSLQQPQATVPRLALGRVWTLEPLFKLQGNQLPATLDLSATKVCRLESGEWKDYALHEAHAAALTKLVMGLSPGHKLNTIRIHPGDMDSNSIADLQGACRIRGVNLVLVGGK